MLVASVVAGQERGRINRCIHGRLGHILLVQGYCAGYAADRSANVADAHVTNLEADVRMGRVDRPTGGLGLGAHASQRQCAQSQGQQEFTSHGNNPRTFYFLIKNSDWNLMLCVAAAMLSIDHAAVTALSGVSLQWIDL